MGEAQGAGARGWRAEVQPCTSALTQRLLDLRGGLSLQERDGVSVGARRAGGSSRETAGREWSAGAQDVLPLHAPAARGPRSGLVPSSLVWCSVVTSWVESSAEVVSP